MRGSRLLPLTGVAAIVLFVISTIIEGETPDPDASASEAVKFYTENDTSIAVSALLAAIGLVALLFFFGHIRTVLRQEERGSGLLSATSFAGGVILVTGLTIFLGLEIALADVSDKLDPSAVQAINALNGEMFPPVVIGEVIFILSAGLAILATNVLPRWLGWVAIVIIVLGFTPVGFFAFLAALVWIMIVSVLLSQRAGGPATVT
jgi:hypothetical protein